MGAGLDPAFPLPKARRAAIETTQRVGSGKAGKKATKWYLPFGGDPVGQDDAGRPSCTPLLVKGASS